MNKTNKKGFTLVELLVVIAILAILATVSVVGYTAFIERASVSNDENVAAQLNQFLTAMKADSTGDFYNQPVTKDNVWKVVDTMLKENGTLTELKPQSLDYGYHYFFDITDQKFIVLKDSVSGVKVSGIKLLVHAEDPKKPGFFTYPVDGTDHEIFLIDTTGSDLATAIRGFYTFDGIEAEEGKTAWEVFQEAIGKAAQNGEPNYTENLNSTIFVTKDGNKTTEDTTDKTNAVIHDGVNSIEGSDDVDFSDVDNMNIPGSVQVIDNDVLGQLDGATITTDKTPEEIKGMIFEENSTGSSATITIKSGSTTITITITTEGKNEIKNDGQDVAGDYFSNPITDFDAKFTADVDNKVSGNYVAWDVNTFNVEMFNAKGEKDGLPVSESNITWSSTDATVTVNNGKITIVKNPDDEGFSETITIKGVAEGGLEKTFTVNFVYLESVTYTLDGKDVIANSDVDLLYGAENISSYTLIQGFKTNVDVPNQMVLDTAAKIVNADSKFELNGETLTLKSSTSYGRETLTIQPGKYDYLKKDVITTLFNAASLVFHKDNENIQFVGNTGAEITAGDLFKLNLNDSDIPNDAQIWLITELGDTKFSLKSDVSMATEIASATIIDLDSADWKSTKITFKANGGADFTDNNNAVVTAVIVSANEKIRISDQHTIRIVDGKNVRSYSDLASDSNNVLISKLSGTTSFTLNKGKTLYGNGFVIDFTGYDDTKTGVEALIYLNGAIIDNTKVVGNVYTTFNYQNHTDSAYGAALVCASNDAMIKDTYLANTRTPLLVNGNTSVKDSIIFGGIFANILVEKGVLSMDGDVTTINQTYKGVTGAGIVCNLTASENYVLVNDTCNLTQYNFVSKNASLPTIKISVGSYSMTVSMTSVVTKLMNDATYSSWKYDVKDINGNITNSYFNTGIVYLTATGDVWSTKNLISAISSDNKSKGKVPNGYELATYQETYLMGPDNLNLKVSSYAHTYSPKAKDSNGNDTDYMKKLFVNAMNEEFMSQYLPENYCK